VDDPPQSLSGIVHTHTAKAGFLGRLAAALAGTPVIIHTVHGVTFHAHMPRWQRAFYLLLERIAGRFTHQFVTVGEDVKARYVEAGIGEARAYDDATRACRSRTTSRRAT
jgi:hypothetical protein